MTAIDDKYAALGGSGGFLGAPTGPETPTPDGVGRFRHYQNGSIYWHPSTGAHEVHGSIRGKWAAMGWERSLLGYPTTDETATPDGVGRFNHFQFGSVYWTPSTGAHEVHGAIRVKWASLGWERSVLGYPMTDETTTPDGIGRFNHFQNGSIYWTPSTGAWEVHGSIRGLWSSLGWERSALGYPISDEMATASNLARFSRFQFGSIYWDAHRGAYEVWPPPPPSSPDPAHYGRWQVAPHTSGVTGVHAALLHTNKVLFFTYREPHMGGGDHHAGPQPHGDSTVLDLATGTVTNPPLATGELNLFCSGHAFLGDGRLLIVGGEREGPGVRGLHVFDPVGGKGDGAWQRLPDLPVGRWYPTAATLPDGRVFMIGGVDFQSGSHHPNNNTFAVYSPATGLGASRASTLLAEAGGFVTYPFAFMLPNGRLLLHAGWRTRFLDPNTGADVGTAIEGAARPGRNRRTYNLEGTAVMLPLNPSDGYRARVMVIGGGGAPNPTIRSPATDTCEILDTGAATPAWRLTMPMANPRVMPDSVLLPDGNVLVTNGSSTGVADNGANPVYEAEMFDPATERWSRLANMRVPRLYHATALLLPDGRVLTAGTDSMWNPDPFHEAQLRIEYFSPPYLHRGPRPVLSSAPAAVAFGSAFTVQTPDPNAIASAALVRCGSVTHSFNPDQRHVGLSIMGRSGTDLSLRAPPNGCVAPPGYYMLFLLNANKVPSVARFVRLQ